MPQVNKPLPRWKKYGRRYPWVRWFGTLPLILQRGRDYEIRTNSMAQLVRQAARYRGIPVDTRTAEDEQSLYVSRSIDPNKKRRVKSANGR